MLGQKHGRVENSYTGVGWNYGETASQGSSTASQEGFSWVKMYMRYAGIFTWRE